MEDAPSLMTSLATPKLAALLFGPGMLPHAANNCIGAPSLTISGNGPPQGLI